MISINLNLQIRITGRVPSILLYIHTQKFLGHSCLLLQNTVFQLIPSVLLTDILHYSIILILCGMLKVLKVCSLCEMQTGLLDRHHIICSLFICRDTDPTFKQLELELETVVNPCNNCKTYFSYNICGPLYLAEFCLNSLVSTFVQFTLPERCVP